MIRAAKKILLLLLAVMLVASASAAGIAFAAGKDPLPEVNFKADYGFERHSVTKQDVGLEQDEFFYRNFADESMGDFSDTEMGYDPYTAQFAMQGMLNREEAILFMNVNTFHGVSPGEGDDVFIEYFTDPDKHNLKPVQLESIGFAALVESVGRFFNGIILYEYDGTAANPSANFVLAYNLANANFCIPVKRITIITTLTAFAASPSLPM